MLGGGGGGRMNLKDYIGNIAGNNVVVTLDDTEMDNENENNPISSSLSGLGNLLAPNLSGLFQSALFSQSGLGRDNNSVVLPMASSLDFEIENSSIDLDTYVTGYTGLMRINRLLFVAEHCPMLRLDALRMALNFVTETFNVQLYNLIHKQLTDAFAKLYSLLFFLSCCYRKLLSIARD